MFFVFILERPNHSNARENINIFRILIQLLIEVIESLFCVPVLHLLKTTFEIVGFWEWRTSSSFCLILSLADLISRRVHFATLPYHLCSFSWACSLSSFLLLKMLRTLQMSEYPYLILGASLNSILARLACDLLHFPPTLYSKSVSIPTTTHCISCRTVVWTLQLLILR